MSKIPALTPKQLVAALKRDGYVEHRQKGSHLTLVHTSRRSVIVPMHHRDMSRPLMKAIIKEAGYSEDSFLTLL